MIFRLDFVLTQSRLGAPFELLENMQMVVSPDGFITDFSPFAGGAVDYHLNDLVMPSLANAHSHGFQIGMRGVADNPKNFADWVDRYLYPDAEQINENEFRMRMRLLYRELLAHGVTSLGEFHYFHHNSFDRDFSYDRIVLEEAKAAGIRLSLLQSAYDLGTREAQKRFHSNSQEFGNSLTRIENWLKENNLTEQWSLSVAPHSLHGCSPELLESAVDYALRHNRHWHIHLAEQKHDLPHAQKAFGTSPLLALREILGEKLNSKASLVHAVWLSEEELDLFTNLKLNLIYNPLTNMYLGDGISQTRKMDFTKSKIALGTDSNNAFNMFNEAKSLELLQRTESLEMGILNPHQLLASITSFSGELLNLKTGLLTKDYAADMIELRFYEKFNLSAADISVDTIVNHLIFSGIERADIKRVHIGGKVV
jgi:5-methylthioadenosine/S-adenosylhomocysteine deaminase